VSLSNHLPPIRIQQNLQSEKFIDYNNKDGPMLQGIQYWKTFWDYFEEYLRHPENKFDGNIGVLARRNIQISTVTHIGKESNRLDESEILGLDNSSYVEYSDVKSLDKRFKELTPKILKLKPKDVKKFGISKQTLWNIKNKIETKELYRISIIIKARLLQSLITINVD